MNLERGEKADALQRESQNKKSAHLWYVLYTTARAEKRVEERLRQMGMETFLPLHRVKRRWSDRMKLVEIPLFNSYVFVRCSEPKLRELLLVYGVARIVFYLGRPAVVRELEIDAIKEFLVVAAEREIVSCGDEVDIVCGPFEKLDGKVIEVGTKFAKLYLKELGAKIYVSLLNISKKQKSDGL